MATTTKLPNWVKFLKKQDELRPWMQVAHLIDGKMYFVNPLIIYAVDVTKFAIGEDHADKKAIGHLALAAIQTAKLVSFEEDKIVVFNKKEERSFFYYVAKYDSVEKYEWFNELTGEPILDAEGNHKVTSYIYVPRYIPELKDGCETKAVAFDATKLAELNDLFIKSKYEMSVVLRFTGETKGIYVFPQEKFKGFDMSEFGIIMPKVINQEIP